MKSAIGIVLAPSMLLLISGDLVLKHSTTLDALSGPFGEYNKLLIVSVERSFALLILFAGVALLLYELPSPKVSFKDLLPGAFLAIARMTGLQSLVSRNIIRIGAKTVQGVQDRPVVSLSTISWLVGQPDHHRAPLTHCSRRQGRSSWGSRGCRRGSGAGSGSAGSPPPCRRRWRSVCEAVLFAHAAREAGDAAIGSVAVGLGDLIYIQDDNSLRRTVMGAATPDDWPRSARLWDTNSPGTSCCASLARRWAGSP